MAWTAEALFEKLFAPLYPPDVDLARARTEDVNPAQNPRLLEQLDAIADTFVEVAPQALGAEIELDGSDASVHRLASALTRERRDALLAPGDDGIPPLVHLVTHGAVYVGRCVVQRHEGAWQMRNPLWESRVRLASRAGIGELATFQWWLKALSDHEIDEPTLGDRYRLHVEVPCARPDELPVIAPAEREIPRLKKVTYDTLVKVLQKHLPELKGVGPHFPTPAQFTGLGFHWLELKLIGGGRMALLHGPTDKGVHLFWLDASGFAGAQFYPADAFPEHIVREDGDKLQVHVPILGEPRVHEMLWSGPAVSGESV